VLATDAKFDIAGRCGSGELNGRTLKWLDGVEVQWFAWAAGYPRTTVLDGKTRR
jgi:hypothetical protein